MLKVTKSKKEKSIEPISVQSLNYVRRKIIIPKKQIESLFDFQIVNDYINKNKLFYVFFRIPFFHFKKFIIYDYDYEKNKNKNKF